MLEQPPKATKILHFVLSRKAIQKPEQFHQLYTMLLIYIVMYIVIYSVIHSNTRNTNIMNISMEAGLVLQLQLNKSKPHFRKPVKEFTGGQQENQRPWPIWEGTLESLM